MSDTLKYIGKTYRKDDVVKDAVHIAVVTVEAGMNMRPGRAVFIDRDGRAYNASEATSIGIVDPFLKANVKQGDKFFLFMQPESVSNVRHSWSHPAIADGNNVAPVASEEPTEAPMPSVEASKTFLEYSDGIDGDRGGVSYNSEYIIEALLDDYKIETGNHYYDINYDDNFKRHIVNCLDADDILYFIKSEDNDAETEEEVKEYIMNTTIDDVFSDDYPEVCCY